jgi:hypothetical protein
MAKPKINVFWASMGAAALLLVAIYFLGVMPKQDQKNVELRKIAALTKELDTLRAEAAGRPDIEGWKKYRSEAQRAYKDITKFYADSDQALERWFIQNPNRGSFMTKFRDEGARLEEELAKKGCHVGLAGDEEEGEGEKSRKKKFGFNWEDLQIVHWNSITQAGPEEEQKVLRELQKRYWARQRTANLVLAGGVKVSRIADFRFFKKLHPAVSNAPWEQAPGQREGIAYQGLGGEGAGAMRGFQESQLPNELGGTLTFGVALELPFPEVPKAVQEMLATRGPDDTRLINLVGVHVTTRAQNEPYVKFQYLQGNEKDKADKTAEVMKNATARDVLLTITAQILDVEPSKVKNLEAASGQ